MRDITKKEMLEEFGLSLPYLWKPEYRKFVKFGVVDNTDAEHLAAGARAEMLCIQIQAQPGSGAEKFFARSGVDEDALSGKAVLERISDGDEWGNSYYFLPFGTLVREHGEFGRSHLALLAYATGLRRMEELLPAGKHSSDGLCRLRVGR